MHSAPPPRPSPPKRRRERLLPFFVVMAACVLVVAALVWPQVRGARGVVDREDLSRAALLQVRDCELALHEAAGRYGTVRELAEAGLLSDLDVAEGDGGAWVRTDGYRIDVLLPHARLGPGVVGITPDGSGTPIDPDLATRHFAVVARPVEPGVTGFRMWYVDERGDLYLNEGVIDDASAARNDLPTTQVLGSASLDTASFLLWQKESSILLSDD